MNAQILTFSANEQTLIKTGGIDDFASNTVSYAKATFTLGTNWTGFDSVRAVWKTACYTISTVLDANHSCDVPPEVLSYKAKVYVNLVGSISENGVLTDRLTTFPVLAMHIKSNAPVEGTETAPVTASQFEQFVETVQDAADSISDYSYDSEAWAVGKRGGVDVPSTDPTYHKNSKYWAEQNAGLSDEVADLKEDFTAESEMSAEVYEKNSGSIGAAGNIVLFFPIKAGETYTVKNTGVSGMSVFSQNTKGTTSVDVVEQISNWIAASGSVTWTAGNDAQYVRAYCIGQSAISIKRTGTIIDSINGNISDLNDETTFIKSKIVSGYEKETQTLTITDGSYYSAWDGSVNSHEDSERTDKISVNTGDVYFISGTYHNAVALISAFNGNNAFVSASSVFDTGATVHDVVDYKYTVPSGITKIAFSSFTNDGRGLTVKKGVPIYAGDASEEMYSLFTSKIGSGYWKDKKIVWYGTSIPEGGYPQIVGELLGANVINEAVGTSRVHFKYPITPTEENPYCFGTGFKAAARTMSNTLEEQEWIIDNWNSNFWTADKPDAMTEELAEEIRSYSYENKIGKYLTDETFPDLFVFDHGHNDTTGTLEIQNQYYSQYGEYNLYTFRGAMNFLIKQILEYNPKARIVMIGEYTGTDSDFVPNMQLQVAHDWNIPICKQWERLGWTKTKSITVNAHWVKIGSYYYWTPDSTAHTMTVFDSWVPDGTHPIFDGSGRANNFIATSIAKWLDNEVNLL